MSERSERIMKKVGSGNGRANADPSTATNERVHQ